MLRLWWIYTLVVSTSMASPCPQAALYLIGSFRPQCTNNGEWLPKQCHGSSGHCWCVDKEGVRITDMVEPGVPLECNH